MQQEQQQQQQPNRNLPREPHFVPSVNYPSGRSIVLNEQADPDQAKLVDRRVTRDWEYVTVARPVDYEEEVYEVPTKQQVKTFVPNIQVREVIKTIPKDTIRWHEKKVELPHQKIIDKYVEVPVVSGTDVKYVPKVEVRERLIETSKPEIKWVEKIIEVPQVKEVVRYIESDKNVETVIRYVPKGSKTLEGEAGSETLGMFARGAQPYDEIHELLTPKSTVPISGSPLLPSSPRLPPSPRLDRIEQLWIPRVSKTVEMEKEVPVTVDIPVPFMVPKPMQIPVEVPVLRFKDKFVPVPVRRHVIPKITFTDETYEVECSQEKPVLVIEDYTKPVPVDVKIRLKEKDIKIIPIDPSELSQTDFHAMWMRVNADLLESVHSAGNCKEVERAYLKSEEGGAAVGDDEADEDDDEAFEGETEEEREERLYRRDEERRIKKDAAAEITDPDFGPLPLHPGHPLMMTFLQSQWSQNASTITHNMYTPAFFRYHASALDSLLHPQPHQVNITQEQSMALGPLPAEAIPAPWCEPPPSYV